MILKVSFPIPTSICLQPSCPPVAPFDGDVHKNSLSSKPKLHKASQDIADFRLASGSPIPTLESASNGISLRLPTGIFNANGVTPNLLFFDNREAAKQPWTKEAGYYDYLTNIQRSLKKKPLRIDDLTEFVDCYNPENRHKRQPTWNPHSSPEGRWRKYTYEELTARDKTSLDLFWLKDKSLTDLDNLPEPGQLAEEIIENLEAGLNSFRAVLASLNHGK